MSSNAFALLMALLAALCALHADAQEPTVCIVTQDINYVCAGGVTYMNPSYARCAGVADNAWVKGPCGADVPVPCICTLEWMPVCYKGETYSNRCFAQCKGATQWFNGTCGTNCNCYGIKNRQVCASGITFNNYCIANCNGYFEYTGFRCGLGKK